MKRIFLIIALFAGLALCTSRSEAGFGVSVFGGRGVNVQVGGFNRLARAQALNDLAAIRAAELRALRAAQFRRFNSFGGHGFRSFNSFGAYGLGGCGF